LSKEQLEKVDHIRARFHVSYEKANEALEESDGDLVQALIHLEKDNDGGEGRELIKQVKRLWSQGNRTKLRIKKNERVVVEIPATMGAIGAVLSPRLTFMGTIAALAGRCQIELDDLQVEEQTANITD